MGDTHFTRLALSPSGSQLIACRLGERQPHFLTFSRPVLSFATATQQAKRHATREAEHRLRYPTFKTGPDMRVTWKDANASMALVLRGLKDYFETKCLYFPRLYFLSEDELLELLANGIQRIETSLPKVFDGMQTLVFRLPERKIVDGMASALENVLFDSPIDTSSFNPVSTLEHLLVQIEFQMKNSLSTICWRAHEEWPASAPYVEWLLSWPCMIALAVDQTLWTREVEQALGRAGSVGLRDCVATLTQKLHDTAHVIAGGANASVGGTNVSSSDGQETSSGLSKAHRQTLNSLITLNVHGRDVLSEVASTSCETAGDFNWAKHLRFYYNSPVSDGREGHLNSLEIRQMTSHTTFCWELSGSNQRLVVTPLTDRCYRAILSSIQLHLGTAIEGPAGSGKTETAKELAKVRKSAPLRIRKSAVCTLMSASMLFMPSCGHESPQVCPPHAPKASRTLAHSHLFRSLSSHIRADPWQTMCGLQLLLRSGPRAHGQILQGAFFLRLLGVL